MLLDLKMLSEIILRYAYKRETLNKRQSFIFPAGLQSKIKLFIGIITSEEEWKHT